MRLLTLLISLMVLCGFTTTKLNTQFYSLYGHDFEQIECEVESNLTNFMFSNYQSELYKANSLASLSFVDHKFTYNADGTFDLSSPVGLLNGTERISSSQFPGVDEMNSAVNDVLTVAFSGLVFHPDPSAPLSVEKIKIDDTTYYKRIDPHQKSGNNQKVTEFYKESKHNKLIIHRVVSESSEEKYDLTFEFTELNSYFFPKKLIWLTEIKTNDFLSKEEETFLELIKRFEISLENCREK